MDFIFHFLKGAIAGFFIAAPIGPVAALCIQRTLTHGIAAGFATGLGSTVADTVWCIVVLLGFELISDFLSDNYFLIQLIGGTFICFIAFSVFRYNIEISNEDKINSLFKDFFSGLFFTITNPITITAFGIVFAFIGPNNGNVSFNLSAGSLVLGVFIGAAVWWALLTSIVSIFKPIKNHPNFKILNQAFGLIILLFGMSLVTIPVAQKITINNEIKLSPFD